MNTIGVFLHRYIYDTYIISFGIYYSILWKEIKNVDTLIKKGTVTYENRADRTEKTILFGKTVSLSEVQIKIIGTSGLWGQIAEIYALKERDNVRGSVTYKGTASETYSIENIYTDISVIPVFTPVTGSVTVNYTLKNIEASGKTNVLKGENLNVVFSEKNGYYLDENCTVPYNNTGVTESVSVYPLFRKIRSRTELTDIKGHWAEDTIGEMYENYLVSGKADGKFSPNDKITRAEFCQILYLISGETSSGAF